MRDTDTARARWTIAPRSVDDPECTGMLRRYFTELVERYWQRAAHEGEVDAAMAAEPSETLAPPNGVFLLAHCDGMPAGCAGVRLLAPGIGELKRMYVASEQRGSGLGSGLLAAAERAAHGIGVRVLRLDTRADLLEARRLYARHGYTETAPYNDNQQADHWFEKHLRASACD